jgi:hypothetical protein
MKYEYTCKHHGLTLAYRITRKNKKTGAERYTYNCVECASERAKGKYQKNRERYLEATRKWRQAHPEARRQHNKNYQDKVRQLILDAYGRQCRCCGEAQEAILEIDHIDGTGEQHRAELGLEGHSFYVWLMLRDFPQDNYQVLCGSCNRKKGSKPYCPCQRAA